MSRLSDANLALLLSCGKDIRGMSPGQDGEDLFQNEFLELWTKFGETAMARKHVFFYAKNRCRDMYRQNKRHRHAPLDESVSSESREPDPHAVVERNEKILLVDFEVKRLKPRLQEAIKSSPNLWGEDRSTATSKNVPHETTRTRQKTAIRILRSKLRGLSNDSR